MAVERRGWLLSAALLVLFSAAPPAAAERPAGGFPATQSDKERAWLERQARIDGSLFSGLAWRLEGAERPTGRVTAIAAAPGRPFSLYVGFAAAGLYRSDDNGASFRPLGADLPASAIGALATDPLHPERLWVGTGDPDPGPESRGGLGLYRSDDGGASFRYSGLGDSDRIARIVVDPRDGDLVYVAVAGKLFTAGGARGIFRSRDGGATWERVFDSAGAENSGQTGAIDLALDPGDPRRLYCATWQRWRRPGELTAAGVGSAIYRSADGGDSWQRLEGGLPAGSGVGRIGLAAAAGGRIYAAIDRRDPLPEAEWELGDGAVNPLRLRRMSREELLAQDPAEVAAFLRRWPIFPGLDAAGLIAAVEAGEIRMADVLTRLEAADPEIFRREIRGVELYRSADRGETWQPAPAASLRGLAFFEGYRFGRLATAPDDPARLYLLGHELGISADGGRTFAGAGPGAGADPHEILVDPSFPRRLWLGGDQGLAVSYDGGGSWTRLLEGEKPEPAREPPAELPPWAPPPAGFPAPPRPSAWDASPRVPGLLWVGSEDGQLWVRPPAGGFAEVGDSLPAARRVSAIAASRHHDERVYVALDGRPDDDLSAYLFRGTELGRSFTPISGDLPAEPISAVVEDPLDGEILYVGTERGVYVTLDRGNHWSALAAGLPAAPVRTLQLDAAGDQLVASVAGRGTFRLPLGPLRQVPRLLAEAPPAEALPAEAKPAEGRAAEAKPAGPAATVAAGAGAPGGAPAPPAAAPPGLLTIFPPAPLAAAADWYRRREPWRRDPATEPRLEILFYTALGGPAELRVTTAEGRVLRRLPGDFKKGIAAFTWDLLLEERLALEAEQDAALRGVRELAAQEREAAERRRKGRKDNKRAKSAAEDEEEPPPIEPPPPEKGALARVPWSEALRLGRPLYVTPGSYNLEIELGGAVARALLVVTPPP